MNEMKTESVAMSVLLLIVLLMAVPVTSRTYEPIVVHYAQSRLSKDGPAMCPLDVANVTLTSSSLFECSKACAKDDACDSMSMKGASTCDVYKFKPRIIAPVDNCVPFKKIVTDNDAIDCPSDEDNAEAIPSKCCALPYTRKGSLHYKCTVKKSGSNNFGCYNNKRKWVKCLMPDEYKAKYEETTTGALSSDPAVIVPLLTINRWILMQRKVAGSSVSFDRKWSAYRNGFGSLTGNGNYWLGLEKVYRLMQISRVKLRVEMRRRSGQWQSAEYSKFSLSGEAGKYRLTVGGYSGDAGNALMKNTLDSGYISNNMKFSTRDKDNDKSGRLNCAQRKGGGWWYKSCSKSMLNRHTNSGWWSTSTQSSNDNIKLSRMLVKIY